ncbi:helix-turn-helix transcriptional regulator [Flagellimonas sp. DF-77]|uniref:helix-turn-helix domain-containing protein n=1 Tax=Flagellimonas algarum TaxID=3230298 RepID=UPI003396B830
MYIIKRLRQKKQISQTDLAEAIEVSLRTIQLYEKKDANIPNKNLTKIADYFGMSIAELYIHEVNEEASPYLSKKVFAKNGTIGYPIANGKVMVMAPVLLLEEQQRYLQAIDKTAFIQELFQNGFLLDFVGDGLHLAFEIGGDAMDDKTKNAIPNGSLVLGRKVSFEEWVQFGADHQAEPLILVLQERIICRALMQIDMEKQVVQCRNLNRAPEYQDFSIPFEQINEVFVLVRKQL